MTNELKSTLQAQVTTLELKRQSAVDAAIADNEKTVVAPQQAALTTEMNDKLSALNSEYEIRKKSIQEEYAKKSSDLAAREKAAIEQVVGAEFDKAIDTIKALYEM